MYVCPSVQAFLSLEPERLVKPGRANIYSMRQNGGKTMVTVSNRLVARGTCHVRSRNPCKKVVVRGAGQTNGRIRPKLCMSIATLGEQLPMGNRRWRPLGTCHRHVPSGFLNSFIVPERLARLGRERHRSTGTDGGKITLSVTEGSWVRIPPGREVNLRF